MRSEPLMTPNKRRSSFVTRKSAPAAAIQFVPHAYQRAMIKWLLSHPSAALYADPGLGKTSVTLKALQLMRKAGGVHRALVIAPMRVCQLVWTHDEGGELAKWSDFADLRVSLLHGKDKDDAAEADADLYVINPDGLKWLIESGHLARLLKSGVDTLVVDELSAFKHPQTKRFKQLKPWLGRFKRRWGLTGSPASNGLLDLFGQAYVIDGGHALGRYITHYRHQFFLPTGYGGYTWKPQDGAEERIYATIKSFALSTRAEDHLDLPELVEQNLWVTLPERARRIYDQLEEDLLVYLDGKTVTAANAAVASGKCRQVASGGLYLDDTDDTSVTRSRRVEHVHDAKTEALVDLIDELQGSPLLVAYEFDHDLERIRKALGKNTPAINGHTKTAETAALALAWNRGELPVLCGHPAAMGHGLNLQACGHHVAWYSLTWNFELYDQLIRRVYRQGQKSRVVVHRILARNTVDDCVAKAISSKRGCQDALLNALRGRRQR